MTLTTVATTDTFETWRTRTNQLVTQSNYYEANLPNYTYANNIGVSANAYANLVGAGANAHMIAVQNGSNTAIGAGANAYANLIGQSANAYMITIQNGSNTAIGSGANAYANLVWFRSNSRMDLGGTQANAFATSAVAGEATLARSATNLTSGTIPVARVSGNYNLITGLGTITSGVWNGTDIALADGGTNASLTASAGAVAYSTASAFAFTTVGTSGQLLQSGATGAPSWVSPASLTVSRSSTTGTADNSNLLGGYSLQFGNTNGVAGRDGAGDITGRLFRAEYQFESGISGGIAFRNAAGAGTDNYTRYCNNPAAVRDWVGAGYTLLGAIATNTGATTVGFNADLSTYKRLFVTAVNVSHNRAGTTGSYFRIYSPTNGASTTCSGLYTGAGFWLGYVDLDLYSGVGIYADDGATVAANYFAIFQYTGGIYFNVSSGHGFDSGAIYVFGAR